MALKRILIVDDDPVARETLSDFLFLLSTKVSCQFKIFEAENGMQGLEMMRKHKPHLVFLDVEMPFLNGIGVLQAMKEPFEKDLKTLPVIMTTGCDDIDTVEASIQKGVKDYLLKPYELPLFLEKVRSVLRL